MVNDCSTLFEFDGLFPESLVYLVIYGVIAWRENFLPVFLHCGRLEETVTHVSAVIALGPSF